MPANTWIMWLAGPGHYAQLPPKKRQQDYVRFAKPKAAAMQQLALAEALLAAGQKVLLLPPPPCPNPELLDSWHLPADHAERQKLEPLLSSLALGSSDAICRAAFHVFTPDECQDGRWHLLPNNGAGDLRQAAGTRLRLQQLQAWARQCDHIQVDEPVAALADNAGESYWRLRTAQKVIHLFAFQRQWGMPGSQLPRLRPPRADAEAQRLVGRRVGLHKGTSLFMRQLWSGPDAGLSGLMDCGMTGDGILLLHEACFPQQHHFLLQVQELLPELRIDVIRSRELPLKQAWSLPLLGGLLLTQEHGHQLLSTKSVGQKAGKVVKRWQDHDWIQADPILLEWDERLFAGGPSRCCIRLPADAPALPAPDSMQLDSKGLARLRDWAETQLPEELLPRDLDGEAAAKIAGCMNSYPGDLLTAN